MSSEELEMPVKSKAKSENEEPSNDENPSTSINDEPEPSNPPTSTIAGEPPAPEPPTSTTPPSDPPEDTSSNTPEPEPQHQETPPANTDGEREESSAQVIQSGGDTSIGSILFRGNKDKRVAIIGSGAAGLAAARHTIATPGLSCIVFEQSGSVGGVWVYSEATGRDQYGVPVHSPMYKDLTSNFPKECMAYPDYNHKESNESYLSSDKILDYLNSYCDHFNIRQCIKFHHRVTRIAPVGKSWSISATDVSRNQEHVYLFDAVLVCSGPNVTPVYPSVQGIARFSGTQVHSKYYRAPEKFAGKQVLVIGLGVSGIEITMQIQEQAKKVIVSHMESDFAKNSFKDNVILKPAVKHLEEKQVFFVDDTVEEADVIIYCTGYTFSFPFLTKDCGIVVDQYVFPLYKHCINIEHPTMAIVGLPNVCPIFLMHDYQARFFLKTLKEEIQLPSKDDMLTELEHDITDRRNEGQKQKQFHWLGGTRSEEYFSQLSNLAQLEPVPPVVFKIFDDALSALKQDYINFRKRKYQIIDNETFNVTELE